MNKKRRSRKQTNVGLKQEKYELAVKSEGKGHTHHPVPSNVYRARREIELEKRQELAFFYIYMLQRLWRIYYSGSAINASGFTHIASER
jgi:hypothetical protein